MCQGSRDKERERQAGSCLSLSLSGSAGSDLVGALAVAALLGLWLRAFPLHEGYVPHEAAGVAGALLLAGGDELHANGGELVGAHLVFRLHALAGGLGGEMEGA